MRYEFHIHMFNKKINLLVIVAALICVCAVGVYYVSSKYLPNVSHKSDIVDAISTINGDVEKLKKDNEEIVKNATTFKSARVRGVSADDYYIGDINAPVQLIVYGNFACAYCVKYHETVKKIIDEYPQDVVVAFRHFVLRDNSEAQKIALMAANAFECAGEQNKAVQMQNRLYQDSEDKMMTLEQFSKDAEEIGLDIVKYQQCMEEDKYMTKIDTQMLEAKRYEVSGTPASFLNGRPIPGAIPFDDFFGSDKRDRKGMKSLIEEELDKEFVKL